MSTAAPPDDRALRGIVLANVATLAMAVLQDWSVLELMWPFWMQNVVIGWYARQRILKLRTFSTEGLRINDRPVAPTRQTQERTASFFAMHYGFFHAIYLFFLLAMTLTTDAGGFIEVTNESTGVTSPVYVGLVGPLDFVVFLALACGFARAHRASHLEHVAADLARSPNLGTLMMLPYARVVPMHLTLILAAAIGGGALWLFAGLKVAAEIAMHKFEHRLLQGRPATGRAHEGTARPRPARPAPRLERSDEREG